MLNHDKTHVADHLADDRRASVDGGHAGRLDAVRNFQYSFKAALRAGPVSWLRCGPLRGRLLLLDK